MTKTLSAKYRPEIIAQLNNNTYDLLIIGGGITGAGIALDATSRGLKVALIEKDDFASGTSSKSTKLIHGGLRYLKQLEIALVREVGQERAIVHRLAPHLVIAEKMLLPLVKGGTFGKLATSIGLRVYDFLAGVQGDDRRVMLNKQQTLQKVPQLRTDILLGGGFYAEYRTDDARLTIENIKTAHKYGAKVLNHTKALDFIYQDGKVSGIKAACKFTGQTFDIRSTYVVSAAGPWVDELRKTNHSLKGKRLFHSKGVHITVSHKRLPLKHAVYFDVPDGRMIFAIPRHRTTYIGTTDTPYQGDLNNIPIYQEDVIYLLKAVNQMFPDAHLSQNDIESSWAGLRPLIYEEGKSPSEMSRKDEIFVSDTGLISISGGKLTGYRKMAEKVTDLVASKFSASQELRQNHTADILLTGGPFKNSREVNQYQSAIAQQIKEWTLPPYYAQYLVANYGRQAESILSHIPGFLKKNVPEIALIRAELMFAMEAELVSTALDFFERRTGRLYFNHPSIIPAMDYVLNDMQNYLQWDESRLTQEKNNLITQLHQAANFKSMDEKP